MKQRISHTVPPFCHLFTHHSPQEHQEQEQEQHAVAPIPHPCVCEAMALSALERARRMKAMMDILGEENQDGVRVIQRDPDPSKRDGDLFARLMAMASYPSEKYRDSLKIMHHLYTERR